MNWFAALFLSLAQDDDYRPQALRDLEAGRQEIQLIQLINETKLGAKQIEKILETVEQAHKILKDFADDNRVALADAAKAIQDLKAALERGQPISDESRQSFGELERTLKERTGEMQQKLKPLAEQLRGALDEKQIRRLASAGKGDPLAPLRNELRKGFEQVRRLPEDDFQSKIPQAVSTRVDGISDKLGGLSPEEKDAERDRILAILQEARNLSDEEFEKKSEALIEKIVGEGKMGELAKKAGPQDAAIDQALGKLFISPKTVAVLRRRLELLKSGQIPSEDK